MIRTWKILKIIDEKEHFTVKLEDKKLLDKMEKLRIRGQVVVLDSFKDCLYFGRPGSTWNISGRK